MYFGLCHCVYILLDLNSPRHNTENITSIAITDVLRLFKYLIHLINSDHQKSSVESSVDNKNYAM